MPLLPHNIVWTLDSYKHTHDPMYTDDTEVVKSYMEARPGAMYPYTCWFGLQYIVKHWLEGVVVTKELIDEAEPYLIEHFKFNNIVWDRKKWDYLVEVHGGKLPILIKSVKEGACVEVSNVLMTIENTGGKPTRWLTNAMETVLMQVWGTTTVCTRSHNIVNIIKDYFEKTVDEENQWLVDYYLHDFGQRATACMEEAGLAGMAHLVNGKGTDTLMAFPYAVSYYGATKEGLGYSVPASEHSVMTSLGVEGEFEMVEHLIEQYPNGILSVVSDSYDIVNAVNQYCTILKDKIMSRNGKFVVRPDSPRFKNDTPADQILWIVQELWNAYGGHMNKKGFKVLDSHVGVIYGDSLTEEQIKDALELLMQDGFSAESCVYGCGGYLLRKVNRDTQRFAIKCSAQQRNGIWYDVFKNPADQSKASKRGHLKLIYENGKYQTVQQGERLELKDELDIIFKDGSLVKTLTFDQIRKNAQN